MPRRTPFAREVLKKVNRLKRKSAYQKGQADANEDFVRSRCLGYMILIIRHYPVWDNESLEFLSWLLQGDVRELRKILASQLPASLEKSLLEKNSGKKVEYDQIQRLSLALANLPQSRFRNLENQVAELLERKLKSIKSGKHSRMARNMEDFKNLFGLTAEEAELCLFLAIMSSWSPAESFFDSHLSCDRYAGRKYLLAAIGMTAGKFEKIIYGRLLRLGFINEDRSWLELSRECLPLINESVMAVLNRDHYKPLTRPSVALDKHVVKCEDLSHLKSLLATPQTSATHVLFYGPPGTGKTSFTRALASALESPAFEILHNAENKSHNRRLGLTACLNLTNHGTGSLIVVDEADSLLNTDDGWFMRGENLDKGWLNDLLEEPGTRVIWITNRVENIDPSVRRRFAYSLNFPKFKREQREQLWLSILRKHRIKRHFNNDDIHRLAGQYEVSAGAIDVAVSKARESGFDGKGDLLEKVNRSLVAHLTLERGGRPLRDKDHHEQRYLFDALNLSCKPATLENQVRKFDKWWRLPLEERPVKRLNLLFHGPSGTGKTELVRHFAHELDRPLLVKRTSDLMGSYVGETERSIARAFDQAESQEAVLLIDEADSLLFPRSRAQRSWEVSFTNEFLTQMERFRGMLVCTTNRVMDLDDASLRRFGRKVGFGYLEGAGILALYELMLLPLVGEKLLGGQLNLLERLDYLTPGIFRVVRDEMVLADGVVGHEEMINALKLEAGLLAERDEKMIGFG